MQGKKKSVEEQLGIPKLFRRAPIHLMFYGYATGRRDLVGENLTETVNAFKKRFGISDEIDIDSALIRESQRMTVDLINEGI